MNTMLNFAVWGVVGYLLVLLVEALPFIAACAAKRTNKFAVLKYLIISECAVILSAAAANALFSFTHGFSVVQMVISITGMAAAALLWVIAGVKTIKG